MIGEGDVSGDPYLTAMAQITAAALPGKATRHALALLQRVNAGGQAVLTWDEACEMFGVVNRGTVRRHLIRLADAGIVHYSTNDLVWVNFYAWLTEGQAAARAQNDAKPRVECTETARRTREIGASTRGFPPTPPQVGVQKPRVECTETARRTREIGASTRGFPPTPPQVGWLLLTLSSAESETNQPDADAPADFDDVNPFADSGPAPEQDPAPAGPDLAPEEIERSVRLLRAAGLSRPETLQELALGYPFDELLRQTFAWQRDLAAGKIKTPGALASRVRSHFQAPELPDGYWLSPLYLRATAPIGDRAGEGDDAGEPEAGDIRAAGVDQAPAEAADSGPPESVDDTPAGCWRATLAVLKLRTSKGSYEKWLSDTACEGYADGVFTIRSPSEAGREWLEKRLRRIVAEALRDVVGQAVEVVFTAGGTDATNTDG